MKNLTTLCIVMLLLSNIIIVSSVEIESPSIDVNISKLQETPHQLSMEYTSAGEVTQSSTKDGELAIQQPGDQHHLSSTSSSQYEFIATWDEFTDSIIYCYSNNHGETYKGGFGWNAHGNYPSIDYWRNQKSIIGAFVTDSNDHSAGATYHLEIGDITNENTYKLQYWDWSIYGWFSMKAASCASGNTNDDWFWGVNAYVMSTTYNSIDLYDGPFITYQTDETGTSTISWYDVPNCGSCDISIDQRTQYSHSIFDHYDSVTHLWQLFLRCDNIEDFDDDRSPVGGYHITSTSNLRNPSIISYDDIILVACEADGQIVCYRSTGNLERFTPIPIANGEYPDIQHVSGNEFLLTYQHNQDLYLTKTTNGGLSWQTPQLVATEIVEDYHSTTLSNRGDYIYYEHETTDIDMYRVDIPADGTIIAYAGGPYETHQGESILFDGAAVGGTQPYSWSWDLGDGTTVEEENPAYIYQNEGTYTTTLTVIDNTGLSASDTATVMIYNTAPLGPQIQGPIEGKINTEVQFNLTSSDPDEDAIRFIVDWGDESGETQTAYINSGETLQVSHTWTEKGEYTIRVKTQDEFQKESDWATLAVTMPLSPENPYVDLLNDIIGWLSNHFPTFDWLISLPVFAGLF